MLQFDRLIQKLEDMAARSAPQTQFFAQIGSGSYEPKHMRFVRFAACEEFGDLVADTDVVISHASIGIADTLKFGMPRLVLPRRRGRVFVKCE